MEDTGELQEKTRDENNRFVKGVSGNPSGKPKGAISLVSLLKRKLKEAMPKEKMTYGEKVIEVMVNQAVVYGDVKALKDIIDRIDGKPTQTILAVETDYNSLIENLENEYKPDELSQT